MDDQKKRVIDDLVNGRVDFDSRVHGTDHGLLEAMASGTYKSFKVIPGYILSPPLIEAGSKSLCELMGEEDCFTPGDYEATALKLITRKVGLNVFHQDLLTKKIIETCLDVNLRDTIERRNRIGSKGQSFITPEILNRAVASRIDILDLLDPSEVRLITDESLITAIRNDQSQGMKLDKVGRRDILIKEIASGLWFNQNTEGEPGDILIKGNPRPLTLPEAISVRMKMDQRNAHDILYYDCYAAGFPVENFKSLVRSKARQEWIIGIFPAKDLIPVFKGDLGMKGKILEQDLGM